MRRNLMIGLATLVLIGAATNRGLAHCQIPCGIYDDPVRFSLLEEHLTTIEKSSKQIVQLSQDHDHPDYNMITRWVMNKEDHVGEFTEIVTYYFMAQRVKPAAPEDKAAYEKYVKQITLLHQMVVQAMKAKQTTDLAPVEALRALLRQFHAAYMEGK